jgi:hypothetical protein
VDRERPDGSDPERPYYGPARIAGGLACLVVDALYVLVYPVYQHDRPEPIVIGIFAATGAGLLGVQALANRLLGK